MVVDTRRMLPKKTAALFFLVVVVAPIYSFNLPASSTVQHAALFPKRPDKQQRYQNNVIVTSSYSTDLRAQEVESTSDEGTFTKEPSTASSSPSSWFWICCLPLWLIYISNQWSRYSISYLVDFSAESEPFKAMNADIGFDQAQYGVLASVAFSTLYAIAALGAGIATDRYNRKSLTMISAMSWSLATIGTALANSFEAVLAYRIVMGLACAVSTPTAYTLLRDRVRPDQLATASAVYGTGVTVASGMASLTLLLDEAVGWRVALDMVAGSGLVATAITFLLLNDDEGRITSRISSSGSSVEEGAKKGSGLTEVSSDIAQILKTPRLQWLYLASFLRFASGLCIGVWSAPFFRMKYVDYQSQYAVTQAIISAGLASFSGLLGGAVADWWSSSSPTSRDPIGKRLWIPVIGSVLAAPAWFFAVQTGTPFEAAMCWLAVEYLVAECWFGPTISTLQSTVNVRVGGTAQGLLTLTGGIANLAPSVLGYFYGQLQQPSSTNCGELSMLLTAFVCFGYVSSAFCFAAAALSTPDAINQGGITDTKTK